MNNCPICNSKAVGKVGTNQYYCWNCFIEYNTSGEEVAVFDIGEDGTLTSLEPLEFDTADVEATLS